MKPDTKKAAALIVALGKKPKSAMSEGGDEFGEGESEGEMDEGKLSCADDIIAALDNKDSEALVRALEAFLDQR